MFPLPFQITTRPSLWARSLLLAAHGAAGLALGLADLPVTFQVVGTTLLTASALHYWRSRPGLRLRCKADGALECWRGEAWQRVEVHPDAVVLPWLVVLAWREKGKTRRLMIPRDALAAEEHRHLRVWLKWRARDREGAASVESAG